MTMSIRVVLADEYELVRQGVRLVLEQEPTIQVVGEARSADEALEVTARLRPDVVVIDVGLPECIRKIKVRMPAVRVLVLSQCREEPYVVGMLRAGADGYILKQGASEGLIRAVHSLGMREVTVPVLDSLLKMTPPRNGNHPDDVLSEREREILALVAEGYTSKGIARRLQLSPRTVGNHRARILAKLQVDNCVQAAAQALQLGLISLPPGGNAQTSEALYATGSLRSSSAARILSGCVAEGPHRRPRLEAAHQLISLGR